MQFDNIQYKLIGELDQLVITFSIYACGPSASIKLIVTDIYRYFYMKYF